MRIILTCAIVTVLLLSVLMVNGLYRASGIVDGSDVLRDARREQFFSIDRGRYEDLIARLKGPYVSKTSHVRDVFSLPSAAVERYTACYQCGSEIPADAEVCPVCGAAQKSAVRDGPADYSRIEERLIVSKIYKKPVRLLFKGYIQLGDGTYVATINWEGKTDFKKVGDEIRGYQVVDFKRNVSEKKTLWGGTEKVDSSTITLERGNDERFDLEIGKLALEREIYALLWDRKEAKDYDVYVGADVFGNKILDISAEAVTISTQDGGRTLLRVTK